MIPGLENVVRIEEIAGIRTGYRLSWPNFDARGGARVYQDFYIETNGAHDAIRQSDISSSDNPAMINDQTLYMDGGKCPRTIAYKHAKAKARAISRAMGWRFEDGIKIAMQIERDREAAGIIPPIPLRNDLRSLVHVQDIRDKTGRLKKQVILSDCLLGNTTYYNITGSKDGYEPVSEKIYFERFKGRFLVRTTGMMNLYNEVPYSEERTLFIGDPGDMTEKSERKILEDITYGFARDEAKEFARINNLPFIDTLADKMKVDDLDKLLKQTREKSPKVEIRGSRLITGLIIGAAAAGGIAYALHEFFG